MAKIFLMCGKICSGKSTHAEKLRKEYNAVILSVDEITLALFGQDAGEKHDYYVEKLKEYLYKKSLEILEAGVNVVLDWGYWTRAERDLAREFYGSHGVEYEFHYIDISDEEWYRRLAKRNEDVLAKKTDAYYVDDGLAKKFQAIFEKPEKAEDIKVF
ncbi:MAG: ATP-binding protein [Lachnospiraceae bacterium]|nr:ATP-binding protein [Lachnospiraceae bacterium]